VIHWRLWIDLEEKIASSTSTPLAISLKPQGNYLPWWKEGKARENFELATPQSGEGNRGAVQRKNHENLHNPRQSTDRPPSAAQGEKRGPYVFDFEAAFGPMARSWVDVDSKILDVGRSFVW
jgi:hypothetical protein